MITDQAIDEAWMRRALELARLAETQGEVPVGAVVVRHGELLAKGHNQPITACDPTAHAEVVALRAAALASGNYRLPDADLYVTLEPCAMCVGAMVHARIRRVIFAAADPKSGAVGGALDLCESPGFNHRIVYQGGLLATDSAELLRDFFRSRRKRAAKVPE